MPIRATGDPEGLHAIVEDEEEDLEITSDSDDDSNENSDNDNDYEDIDTDELESGDAGDDDDDDEGDDDDDDVEEEESEDEEQEGKPVVPKSIRTNETCSIPDIDLHPSQNLLAAATLRGKKAYVELYKYSPEEKAERLIRLQVSRKESRAISFSKDGSNMIYLSKDKTMRILDTGTGEINRILHNIHDSSPHCLSVIDENLLATGDDEGQVKVWDLRHQGSVAVFSDDTMKPAGITKICHDERNRLIFAVSADGVMGTYNARQRKLLVNTEKFEFGLNCAETIKGNTKLLVGTEFGLMHLYNWDEFAAPSDSFPAASGASIDSITRVSDDLVFAACEDNYVRAISILPNRVISKVCRFPGMPPDKVVRSWDNKYVAGLSYIDGLIKFFDVESVTKIEVSDREKTNKSWKLEKKVNQHRGSQKSKKRKQQALDAVDPAKRQARAEFFSNLDSDLKVDMCSDEESDYDEDSAEKPSCSKA